MSDSSLGFNLIGRDISASRTLRGVGDQAQRTSGAFASMGRIAGGVGAGLAAAFSVGALTSFATEAIDAARESQKTSDRLDQIAKSMGVFYGELGGTTKRLQDYATELMNVTGVNDETTKSAQAILLTFKNLASTVGDAGGMFDRATVALLDLSAAGFGDATTNAKSLGKALQDPVKGLTALGRQGITFTDQEKAKVKALVATNQTLEAQNVIMAAVEMQVGGTAKAIATDFDKISAAVGEAQETIGGSLIRSTQYAINAFGGSGGLSESIDETSSTIANFIDGVGLAAAEIGNLKNSAGPVGSAFDFMGGLRDKAINLIPPFAFLEGQVRNFTDSGELAKAKTEQLTQAMTDGTLSQRAIAESIKGTTSDLSGQEVAAEATASAVDELKAAQDRLNNAFSDAQALLDYRRYLQDLEGELKGNARAFTGHSKEVRENQDYLIDGLDLARAKVTQWARDNKIAAEDVESVFAGRAKKIVDAFIADGFKLSDIRKFLKSTGLWTQEMENLFNPNVTSQVAAVARSAGAIVGKQMALGVAGGIYGGQAKVNQMSRQLMAEAAAAMKSAAEIESPSKLTAREVGEPLTDGVAVGVEKGTPKAVAAGVKMVKTVIDEMAKFAAVATSVQDAIAGNAQDFADLVGSAWGEVSDALSSAQGDLDSFVSGARNTFMGAIDLGAAWTGQWDSAGKSTGISLVQGFENQVKGQEWFQNVIKAIDEQGGSDALIAEIMSKGVAIGGALGQGILDQGLVDYFSENLATVENSATQTANAIVPSFITAGVAAAQAMATEFIAQFGEHGPARTALMELMDSLAQDMSRTVVVDVQVAGNVADSVSSAAAGIVANVPHFAEGGIVTGPTIGLMGEAGPEAVVPLDRLGSIGGKGGFTWTGDVVVQGSVVRDRDLVVTVRDGIGREMRRKGLDPALIGA